MEFVPTLASSQADRSSSKVTAPDGEHDDDAAVDSKVLVVDDDELLRAQLCRHLRRAGFEPIEASDGREGLEKAGESPPRLAVVDLCMPEMDGYELVSKLKEKFGFAIHTTVLSGSDTPEERVKAFDVGADDFVSKPAFWPEVVRRVRAAFRLQDARARLSAEREASERLRVYAAEATALLAHDLNNGFCVALSNVDLLLETVRLEDSQLQALAAAKAAVHRMAGLVSNFIDVGRFEDEELRADRKPVDVRQVMKNVVEIHDCALRRTRCELQLECEPDTVAHIDPVLFERVLHNLFGNAIRYADVDGTVLVSAKLIDDEQGRLALRVEIGNTGPSVPDELKPRLFDKYSRGGNDRRSRGMGLYFCRLASEAHGGRIWCESRGERFTVFCVELPINGGNDV